MMKEKTFTETVNENGWNGTISATIGKGRIRGPKLRVFEVRVTSENGNVGVQCRQQRVWNKNRGRGGIYDR